jgi:hypothetical protein
MGPMMACCGMEVMWLEIIAASVRKMMVMIIKLDTMNNKGDSDTDW